MDEFEAEDSPGESGDLEGSGTSDGTSDANTRSRESYWYRPENESVPARSAGGRWIDPARLAKSEVEIAWSRRARRAD